MHWRPLLVLAALPATPRLPRLVLARCCTGVQLLATLPHSRQPLLLPTPSGRGVHLPQLLTVTAPRQPWLVPPSRGEQLPQLVEPQPLVPRAAQPLTALSGRPRL